MRFSIGVPDRGRCKDRQFHHLTLREMLIELAGISQSNGAALNANRTLGIATSAGKTFPYEQPVGLAVAAALNSCEPSYSGTHEQSCPNKKGLEHCRDPRPTELTCRSIDFMSYTGGSVLQSNSCAAADNGTEIASIFSGNSIMARRLQQNSRGFRATICDVYGDTLGAEELVQF
jgi:hypothetical protein